MTRAPQTTWPNNRRGTVLVIVVILLLVVMMISGQMVQSLLLGTRQLERQHEAMQAARMAESGLRRARVQLAIDPTYAGETLSPNLPTGPARIEISIARKEGTVVITARGTFPAETERPARVTRQATIERMKAEG